MLLRSLYSQGNDALVKARGLLFAALAAGVIPLIKDLEAFKSVDAMGKVTRGALLPGSIKLFDWLPMVGGGG